jgi:putative ABC transport system permease protein
MKYARLVLRNLLRNARRTALTVLAIGLAIFTYTTLSGMPYLARHLVSGPASSRRVISMNKGGFLFSLPQAYRQKILAIPHVKAVSALVYFGGRYRSPSDQLGLAVDADAADTLWPDWGVTPGRAALLKGTRMACLAPRLMMRRYGWRVGEQITLRGTIYPVDVTLRIADTLGAAAPPDALLFRRDYLDELLGESGRINAYAAIVDHRDAVAPTIAAIDETFANSPDETLSASEAVWVSSLFSLDTLLMALNGVAAIAIVAMSLVAANTMAMAVRERCAETAVMRALGFGPRLIAMLTLAESAAIGLAGGLAGCAAAFAFATVLPSSMLSLGPVDLLALLPPVVVARALGLSALIGVAAGAVGLAGVARQTVGQALRSVG